MTDWPALTMAFLADQDPDLSRHTIRSRERVVEHFAARATEKGVLPGTLTQEHAEDWVTARQPNIKRSSLNAELSHVRALLIWAHRKHHVPASIDLAHCRRRLGHKRKAVMLTPDVRRLLKGWKDPQQALAVHILALTGMRRGELAGADAHLEWLDEPAILQLTALRDETTKHHERDIPVGPRLAAMIRDHLTRRPSGNGFWNPHFSPDMIGLWLKPRGTHSHAFRAYIYTRLVNWDCPDLVRKAILGHALTGVEEAYLGGIEPAVIRKWTARLEDFLLASPG